MVRSLCSNLDETVFAIALRGSIERNTAMVGSSDIDLLVLTHRSVEPLDAYDLPLPQGIKLDLSQTTYQRFLARPNWRGGDFRWRFPVGCSLDQTVSNRYLHHA